jgi:glucose-1-phosphate thymidylyltransferase
MKGILLAGGTGSRLWPTTISVSKQLLPIYDKPLIYYPIATLMNLGVREILIITTSSEQELFQKLLSDGSQWGISLTYKTQDTPNGIAKAYEIGHSFTQNSSSVLILGDNLFHGDFGIGHDDFESNFFGGLIFGFRVNDPRRYGVVEFSNSNQVISVEEKPDFPKSNFAIPGIYFFDEEVTDIVKTIKASDRGEFEITSIMQNYLSRGKLKVKILKNGFVWLDSGTPESLFDASSYVRVVEQRQSHKIACLEEIAWRKKWISDEQMNAQVLRYGTSAYGKYLQELTRDE